MNELSYLVEIVVCQTAQRWLHPMMPMLRKKEESIHCTEKSILHTCYPLRRASHKDNLQTLLSLPSARKTLQVGLLLLFFQY